MATLFFFTYPKRLSYNSGCHLAFVLFHLTCFIWFNAVFLINIFKSFRLLQKIFQWTFSYLYISVLIIMLKVPRSRISVPKRSNTIRVQLYNNVLSSQVPGSSQCRTAVVSTKVWNTRKAWRLSDGFNLLRTTTLFPWKQDIPPK